MARVWLFAFVSFVVLSFGQAAHASHTCTCPGQALAGHKGGDRSPLAWSFDAFLVKEGTPNSPPLICYSRGVSNSSKLKVLNIRWEAASYFRRTIPGNDENYSCPTLPGELSASPKTGPLHYGISSEQYDTTVVPPKDGWQRQSPRFNRLRISRLSDPPSRQI
jgi:hypothetical protein